MIRRLRLDHTRASYNPAGKMIPAVVRVDEYVPHDASGVWVWRKRRIIFEQRDDPQGHARRYVMRTWGTLAEKSPHNKPLTYEEMVAADAVRDGERFAGEMLKSLGLFLDDEVKE